MLQSTHNNFYSNRPQERKPISMPENNSITAKRERSLADYGTSHQYVGKEPPA